MNALDLINRELAKPMTHVVLTTYADGAVKRHETRGMPQAETWAHLESQKLGRDLISRETGAKVRVVGVEILAL